MLRVRKLANSVTSQVTLPPLQSASVALTPSVSVASFTFCRPFAQADEHTSHRKTRIAVITKSWERGRTALSTTDKELWICLLGKRDNRINTHKDGPKVRVLVDVHVA